MSFEKPMHSANFGLESRPEETFNQPIGLGAIGSHIPDAQCSAQLAGTPYEQMERHRAAALREQALHWAMVCCGESKDHQLVIRAARDFLAFLQE